MGWGVDWWLAYRQPRELLHGRGGGHAAGDEARHQRRLVERALMEGGGAVGASVSIHQYIVGTCLEVPICKACVTS